MITPMKEFEGIFWVTCEDMNKLLAHAIKMERNYCAEICDHEMDMAINVPMMTAAGNCADKIRNRGEQ